MRASSGECTSTVPWCAWTICCDDVEAEAQAVAAARLALAAAERIEEVRQQLGRDRAGVGDRRARRSSARVPSSRTCDRLAGVAVLERVADQVRRDLRQAVGVPVAGEVALAAHLDARVRDTPPGAPAPRAATSAPRSTGSRLSGMPPASRARARSSMSSIMRLMRLPLDSIRAGGLRAPPRPSDCALRAAARR